MIRGTSSRWSLGVLAGLSVVFAAAGQVTAQDGPAAISVNLTDEAKAGRLSPVVGRDAEIDQVIETLARATKRNVALTGKAGVGKTAIVEGLAQRIASGNVPDFLKDYEIVSLNMADLMAGTHYRGTLETKLKNVVSDLEHGNKILFIDELHKILGAGSTEGDSNGNVGEMLKPVLARSSFPVIGATDRYSEITDDKALGRRFNEVSVPEPSNAATLEILEGTKSFYEKAHDVTYTDKALEAMLKLSKRYFPDRTNPDMALDLLDLAGARAKLGGRSLVTDLDVAAVVQKKLPDSPPLSQILDDPALRRLEGQLAADDPNKAPPSVSDDSVWRADAPRVPAADVKRLERSTGMSFAKDADAAAALAAAKEPDPRAAGNEILSLAADRAKLWGDSEVALIHVWAAGFVRTSAAALAQRLSSPPPLDVLAHSLFETEPTFVAHSRGVDLGLPLPVAAESKGTKGTRSGAAPQPTVLSPTGPRVRGWLPPAKPLVWRVDVPRGKSSEAEPASVPLGYDENGALVSEDGAYVGVYTNDRYNQKNTFSAVRSEDVRSYIDDANGTYSQRSVFSPDMNARLAAEKADADYRAAAATPWLPAPDSKVVKVLLDADALAALDQSRGQFRKSVSLGYGPQGNLVSEDGSYVGLRGDDRGALVAVPSDHVDSFESGGYSAVWDESGRRAAVVAAAERAKALGAGKAAADKAAPEKAAADQTVAQPTADWVPEAEDRDVVLDPRFLQSVRGPFLSKVRLGYDAKGYLVSQDGAYVAIDGSRVRVIPVAHLDLAKQTWAGVAKIKDIKTARQLRAAVSQAAAVPSTDELAQALGAEGMDPDRAAALAKAIRARTMTPGLVGAVDSAVEEKAKSAARDRGGEGER